MTLFTTDLIMSWRTCREYPRKRISQICGDHGVTARYLALQTYLPIGDRIWALVHGLPDQERRLFSIDCVERLSQYLDDQTLMAIFAVRQYVFGVIDESVMNKMSNDVWKTCLLLEGIKHASTLAVAWATSSSYNPITDCNVVEAVTKCSTYFYSICRLDVEQAWQLDRLLEWYEHGDILLEEHRSSCGVVET